jgi:uncharacterized membrane protein YkvA (DUF1232 family)
MKLQKEKRKARGVLTEALFLIPNFVRLLARLFTDGRAPTTEKVMLLGTIVYVISPIDLIPDVIPFLGQVDDLYLVSLVLLRFLHRTPADVIREHWDGSGDLATVVQKIARAAEWVLPSRIRRILLGRVEIAPKVKGALLTSPAIPESIDAHKKSRTGGGR